MTKNMNRTNKQRDGHEFAFYVPDLTIALQSLTAGSLLRLSDQNFYHRLARVVRIIRGTTCILFDRTTHILFEVHSLASKKYVEGVIKQRENNVVLSPTITFLLPLLKRTAFESALYSLVECGATVIQPIITHKAQRRWGGQKEYDRAFNIMVAAAEQSKNFSFSTLQEPLTLQEYCALTQPEKTDKIFFDPAGEHVAHVIKKLHAQCANLVLMVGPEGDLQPEEKKILHTHDFQFCALTPTILRASQAVALSVGMFRALLNR